MASSSFDQVDALVSHLRPARWKDPPPVRNFAANECAAALAGASVDVRHRSQVPLAVDEIALWPTDLKVLDGVYVKELAVENLEGRQRQVFLPIFNRYRLRGTETLTPNIYQAFATKSRPSIPVAFKAEIDFSELTQVDEAAHLSLGPAAQDGATRVPMYECSIRARRGVSRLRFDAITLLEALIAKDEPMFRLLLNPFRELNVMHRRVGDVSCVALLDPAALESRDGVSAVSRTSFSLASSLAHWLGEEGRLAELAACARSILATGPLYVPRCAGVTPVKVRGYRLDEVVQVQRMAAVQPGGFWPTTSRQLVIVDVGRGGGRRFDVVSRDAASRRAPPSMALDEEYMTYRAWFG